MSRESIEINIHYGQDDFKELFEELIKITIAGQELPYKSIEQICHNHYITQSSITKDQ